MRLGCVCARERRVTRGWKRYLRALALVPVDQDAVVARDLVAAVVQQGDGDIVAVYGVHEQVAKAGDVPAALDQPLRAKKGAVQGGDNGLSIFFFTTHRGNLTSLSPRPTRSYSRFGTTQLAVYSSGWPCGVLLGQWTAWTIGAAAARHGREGTL